LAVTKMGRLQARDSDAKGEVRRAREEGGRLRMSVSTSPSPKGVSSSQLIDARIKEVGGWKGTTLSQLRTIIKKADPAMVEEIKWKKPTNPMGVPVWSHNGIVCTGGALKNAVRLTFFKGAQMKDPRKLFNASLEGNALRAIDLHEGDTVDEAAFEALILEAVGLNTTKVRAG
jgi:hypothetical protein